MEAPGVDDERPLSFRVGVERKRLSHPYYGQGSPLCFAVDGEQGRSLELVRGFRYEFVIDAPDHPFYLGTSEEGLGEGDLTGDRAVEVGRLSLLIDDAYPELCFYACALHAYMGGEVTVVPHHSLHLRPFVSGLTAPLAIAQPRGDAALYVADQVGVLYRVDARRRVKSFLDLRDRLVDDLQVDYEERGLLSVAFHPNYTRRGRAGYGELYVTYSGRLDQSGSRSPRSGETRPCETRVSRFRANKMGASLDGEEVLLRIGPLDWPHHVGGRLAFGPDGLLYVTVGDAGPQKDPLGHAQDLSVLFGKVLRLDVSGRERGEDERAYLVPGDNPFVGQAGARDEIWAYGFRNPWSISFDERGRCFVADVGLDTIEEVDLVVRGGNYGWNALEGTRVTGFGRLRRGSLPVPPIWEYGHDWLRKRLGIGDAIAVIGGYYVEGRGYVFGDYGGVLLRIDEDERKGQWTLVEEASIPYHVHALGQDRRGRLYVLTTKRGGLHEGEGVVYELLF
jgi:glucose/arabinose dehydrogenase